MLLAAAAALVPWMVFLAFSEPTRGSTGHWTSAWIGIDVMEAVGLAVTGWLVLRRDIRVRMTASATAAFLLSDAWFDFTTAQSSWGMLQASLLAVLAALPLMALCSVVALTAPRWCTDSGRFG